MCTNEIQLVFEQTTKHLLDEFDRRLKNLKDDIWGLMKFKKSTPRDVKPDGEL